jgi:hypothetical protein
MDENEDDYGLSKEDLAQLEQDLAEGKREAALHCRDLVWQRWECGEHVYEAICNHCGGHCYYFWDRKARKWEMARCDGGASRWPFMEFRHNRADERKRRNSFRCD